MRSRFDFGDDLLDRLDGRSHVLDGPNGTVAYDLRGVPDGKPLIWFHGSPSCRLESVLLDAFAEEEGWALAAPERPGLGASSPRQGWTLLDHARDAVRVADHLGWDRFAVAGGSGGGPFVLGMAYLAPKRLTKAVSLACAGAFELEDVHPGWVDRLTAWAARRPQWLRAYFRMLQAGAELPSPDLTPVARLATPLLPGRRPELAELFRRVLREVFAQGTDGAVQDTMVLHRPWGFPVEEIRIPVTLVGGTADGFIPFAYTEAIARRIPGATLEVAPGDGHFETIFDRVRLAQLLADS